MNNLTLIIPAKFESESLPIFIKELEKYDCKKIIIIQPEDIETKKVLNNIKNCEILLQSKPGYGSAIIEGFKNSKTEYSCIINADGSMDPSYLSSMLKECENKDLVFGSRYIKPDGGSEDDTLITFVGNKFFSFLGNFLFNLNISDILYTYILGKTNSFNNLNLNYHDFRLCVEIPIKAKKNNFLYSCTPSLERNRIAGKKKVNAFKDGFLILMAIVKFVF